MKTWNIEYRSAETGEVKTVKVETGDNDDQWFARARALFETDDDVAEFLDVTLD
jgi:hypothetical protein